MAACGTHSVPAAMPEPRSLDDATLLRLANAASRGKRPYFFDDPDIDRLLAIVWAMAGELAVARERIDTLERVLERRGALDREEIEGFRPSAAEAGERGRWQLEYIARLLRILQQEADALARGPADASSEQVAGEVGKS